MYDLLLKRGKLVDPSQGLDRVADIAIKDGLIALIAPEIPATEARRVIDVAGRVVTPGLIDLHAHVYPGFTRLGVDPDLVGVYAGVTTIVDAGSAGPFTYRGLLDNVIPKSNTDVFIFVNVTRTGLAAFPEVRDTGDIDVDAAIDAVLDGAPVVKGVKLRMVSPTLDIFGLEAPRLAVRAARESRSRLMTHIGHRDATYDPNLVRELLNLLEPGDIVTHVYCADPGNLLDENGRLLPEAKEAANRGILLDVGSGQTHFAFDVARRLIDQGLLPHTLSTDITAPGRIGTCPSLVEMMTQFLALGLSLEDVVTMTTANPARALGEEQRFGSLVAGRQADISVLGVQEGEWIVRDGEGVSLPARRAVIPALTVKRGRLFTPEWGPHPWGWEPETSGPSDH